MNTNLSNKNALVGGSSQGIGKATAQTLAQLGANVTLLARNEADLKAVIKKLDVSKGQKHDYIVADFAYQPPVVGDKVKAYMIRNKKNFHILVNNTGGPHGGPIVKEKIENFIKAYNMHLVCNQLLAQTVLDGMKEESYGRIINIISVSVKEPIQGLGVSNTTRWSVAAWAKTWATEVAPFGITVNNILPGYTATNRLYELIESSAKEQSTTPLAIEKAWIESIPMGRLADPSEIGDAVAFLATPAASYITGINLTVDGGRTKSL